MDKEWYKSVTIWGLIIGFVGFILAQIVGAPVISSQEGTDLATNLAKVADALLAVIGIIIGIIGRVKVGKQLVNSREETKRLERLSKKG